MQPLLSALYPLMYTGLLLLFSPIYLFRQFRSSRGMAALWERAGLLLSKLPERGPAPRVWIHAVSVGEVRAIAPLVNRLQPRTGSLFISTTTDTGQDLAFRLFQGKAHVFYFPLDWRWVFRRIFRRLGPDLVLLAESEFWPGFLHVAREMNVPVILVNGRISDRSFNRYRKLSFFFRPLLSQLQVLCVQSKQDKERLVELGIPQTKVRRLGNLKYDCQISQDPVLEQFAQSLESLLRPSDKSLIWVCGSTREGEERLLLSTYASLRQSWPDLRLVLAPRHPHRIPEIVELLKAGDLTFLLRSQWQPGSSPSPAPAVFLLDSIGELAHVYRIADVVFVGGSLFPTGGHNIIEAAFFSRPILFGPHMENFREITDNFLKDYAALQVSGSDELEQRIGDLLQDPAARLWLGRNARKVVRDNQGAVQRTVEVVGECLGLEFSPSPTGSRPS